MPSPTTAQSLGALLKSARDIMRKDKGLSGDLDRLPMLTWVMFLKFLDDLELQREDEAKLARKKFKPAVEPPYRWRDWAAQAGGITGDELLAFINNEEATRPDGKKGAGLFRYLRTLTSSNGDDRRDVIATVFRGVQNRMVSGYLLRDVINKLNGIHFTASDELHTLGALYESMLREMRDAAGDSGEFYTPRAVVRLMVAVTDPRLGETVLDPASGTGGFLVEAFNHLSKQVRTVADRRVLQERSLFGCEPKPLPYLLCQMNLLLHGLDAPQIDSGNALRFKLTDIGERDRVDVILTNPPFGGEEEKGIQGNFPEDRQTGETALLFLQLIMRKLKRASKPGFAPARAAVVVPDGILAGDGVCARIKEELLKEFNLHTILRLPSGVFAPYTGIPTNVLFFDRSGPTRETWFYEHPLPMDRKTYTKTAPLTFEDFAPCLEWWKHRTESAQAWRVSAEDAKASAYNLDVKNPSLRAEDSSVRVTEKTTDLAARLTQLEAEAIPYLKQNVWHELEEAQAGKWEKIRLGDVLIEAGQEEQVSLDQSYRLVGVRLAGEGPFLRETKLGSEVSATKLNRLSTGLFIYSRLFAWRGAFGIVLPDLDGCYVSNEFPTYRLRDDRILPEFLRLYFCRPVVWQAVEKKCQGTTKASRNRFKEEFLLDMVVSVPDRRVQMAIVEASNRARSLADSIHAVAAKFSALSLDALAEIYRGKL
jgi:type I restriction enzyme M protein